MTIWQLMWMSVLNAVNTLTSGYKTKGLKWHLENLLNVWFYLSPITRDTFHNTKNVLDSLYHYRSWLYLIFWKIKALNIFKKLGLELQIGTLISKVMGSLGLNPCMERRLSVHINIYSFDNLNIETISN